MCACVLFLFFCSIFPKLRCVDFHVLHLYRYLWKSKYHTVAAADRWMTGWLAGWLLLPPLLPPLLPMSNIKIPLFCIRWICYCCLTSYRLHVSDCLCLFIHFACVIWHTCGIAESLEKRKNVKLLDNGIPHARRETKNAALFIGSVNSASHCSLLNWITIPQLIASLIIVIITFISQTMCVWKTLQLHFY